MGDKRRECELRLRVDGRQSFNGTLQILNAALAGLGSAYVSEELVLPYTNGCGMIESARTHSRSLHLYGRMVYPEPLAGARMNALLSGNPSLMEMPDGNLERGVATLHKYGKEFHFFAQAPVEFISTLSKAYSDNRLQVFSGRGPASFRGVSVLINIGFQDRRCFEEDWGEPLEPPCE